MKDIVFKLFSIKGKKKPAELISSEFKGWVGSAVYHPPPAEDENPQPSRPWKESGLRVSVHPRTCSGKIVIAVLGMQTQSKFGEKSFSHLGKYSLLHGTRHSGDTKSCS